MNYIVVSAGIAVGAFLFFLLLKYFDRRLTLAAGALFAVYLGLDDFATILPYISSALDPIASRWNWSGKVYSILFACFAVFALRLNPKAVGLTLAQRNLRTSLMAVFVLTLLSTALGFIFRPSSPSFETLAFQALMPGLAEELAYRGVAPALLLGLLRGKPMPQGTPWIVILISALVFGLWHGLGYANASFTFDFMSAAFPFVGGLAYGWLRFHSGSLLLPIAAHGLGNCAFFLASAF